MAILNKWCPMNSHTTCMEKECAWWNSQKEDCNINVIAAKLTSK